jgi:hypothetical protein
MFLTNSALTDVFRQFINKIFFRFQLPFGADYAFPPPMDIKRECAAACRACVLLLLLSRELTSFLQLSAHFISSPAAAEAAFFSPFVACPIRHRQSHRDTTAKRERERERERDLNLKRACLMSIFMGVPRPSKAEIEREQSNNESQQQQRVH